jgi:hypothetical protein
MEVAKGEATMALILFSKLIERVDDKSFSVQTKTPHPPQNFRSQTVGIRHALGEFPIFPLNYCNRRIQIV